MTTTKKWVKEFDKFHHAQIGYTNVVSIEVAKSFIRNLLDTQREKLLKEVEGSLDLIENWEGNVYEHKGIEYVKREKLDEIEEALSKVIEKLKEI